MELLRDWRLLAMLSIASLATGIAITWNPLLATGATVATVGVGMGVVYRHDLPRVFLVALGILLTGYAFFGKAFAYVGVPPLFVGEVVLGLALLAALVNPRRWQALRQPVSWLAIAFGLWGAVTTLPYLGQYGIDALRDGVIWGYSIFALVLPVFLIKPRWPARLLGLYSRLMPWYLLWVPVGLLLSFKFWDLMPLGPGTVATHLRLLDAAGGASVHLGAIAAFMLLGLHRLPGQRGRVGLGLAERALWVIWLLAFTAAATISRGGSLAVLAAIFTVMFLRPLDAGRKLALTGLVAFVMAGSFLVSGISLDIGDTRRKVSPQQIAENLKSVFGEGEEGQDDRLVHTREWRLQWWRDIVDYTVRGEYFWTGKGYGVNLAFDDGILRPGSKEVPNRNPHNGHLTVLARSGVPGLVLWVLLQGGFGISLLRAYLRARRARQDWWARINLWLLAYWMAFLTVMSFGVILEGPHGGIWFWSVFGIGLSALEAQRRRVDSVPGWAVVARSERAPSTRVRPLAVGR